MKKFLFLILMMLPIMAMGADIFRIKNATIKYDKQEPLQVKRAIGDLQADAERVTGCRPTLSTKNVRGPQIIVGTYGKSPLIQKLIKQGVIKEADLKGKWESYVLTVTNEKEPRLVIAGSDTRGTIYGIYDISERMGVSPWYWWADVPVCKNPDVAIQISGDYFASGEPAVKYRGIFINDEDWGLKPWASNHFEKELGDIGPRTYAKVCELLLRLRANMLAPAYRISTKLGGTEFGNLTESQAKYRCAGYQEDGFPGGRWRIPTMSEIRFIAQLSAKGVFEFMFRGDYWSANGVVNVNTSSGTVTASTNSTALLRCVYDSWYWGDEQWNPRSQFVWGDREP
jgi:hypothetical protein